ncbi:MAG: DUF5336 domain-containing protein [Acidimicrobiales bacterium]|jgi:hypothetical protein
MAQFDMKKLDTSDRIVAGMGVLTFICLFLPWYGGGVGIFSGSVNGWGTSWAWIGALLIVGAAAYLVALRSGSNLPKNSYGPGVTVLGLSAIGTILVILRWITIPKGFGYGPEYGMYITIIAGAVQAVLAFRLFKASGEKVPWENKKA